MSRSPSRSDSPPISGIIGRSPAMRDVYRITRRVAASNASVLILGETGVGKELIAGAIHRLSHRSGGPFVRVNCGALSDSLLESELFGHVRGAFTGAVTHRTGRFEAANGGTIFLDEINSTTLTLQVKLLRVLQEKEFQRVGDTTTQKSDARVVAASNRDLMREVRGERFREDLYWRLNVVPIEIPPLRRRREDIPELVSHFLDVYNEINDRFVSHIGPGTMEAMRAYDWPGNVRELQNCVERAVVMSETDELTVDLLPPCITGGASASTQRSAVPDPSADPFASCTDHADRPGSAIADASSPAMSGSAMSGSAGGGIAESYDDLIRRVIRRGIHDSDGSQPLHPSIVDRVEKELIDQVLRACGGVQTKAAGKLGINRNTLHKKIKDYGIGE